MLKLDEILAMDIKKLFEEVAGIQEEVVKEWLIDENSNNVEVIEFLTNLMDRLLVCVSQMEEYRKYQKEFKVCLIQKILAEKIVLIAVSLT